MYRISCSAASRFLAFLTMNQRLPVPPPAKTLPPGPVPFGGSMRYVSSLTGFLSNTALANIVPAFEVKKILPARYASLLLGSVQAFTPVGSILAHLGSV